MHLKAGSLTNAYLASLSMCRIPPVPPPQGAGNGTYKCYVM